MTFKKSYINKSVQNKTTIFFHLQFQQNNQKIIASTS